MSVVSSNNKRIAKNTILLYIRMILLMLIGLYTSRVVLDSLGVNDYGIYNVVGGVVSMFTMISGALSASISRFITFELGKGDIKKLNLVFSTSVTIQIVMALIFALFAETIGLWFVNEKLVIEHSRLIAANWVYQFSILTFMINIISVPYNAEIIAHEKMSVFAYITIIEGLGKLFVAWAIVFTGRDKLILYALLLLMIAIAIRAIYGVYCKKHIQECTYHFVYDRTILKNMFSFAGWNMIGATSAVCRDHGGNIIINLFFGTAVNGARAIAIQVSSVLQHFVGNFQTALNPQIIKNYASGNREDMIKLVFRGARFSYYILFIIALPFFINADYVLSLWLKVVPEHTSAFLRLVLLFTLFESLSGPLMTAMYATGIIRNYQIVVGGIQLLNLPISYIFLYYGFPCEVVFIIAIILSFFAMVARLFMLKPLVQLSISSFMIRVWGNVMIVSFISTIIPFLFSYNLHSSFLVFLSTTFLCLLCSSFSILYIGCKNEERSVIYAYIQKEYCKARSAILKK